MKRRRRYRSAASVVSGKLAVAIRRGVSRAHRRSPRRFVSDDCASNVGGGRWSSRAVPRVRHHRQSERAVHAASHGLADGIGRMVNHGCRRCRSCQNRGTLRRGHARFITWCSAVRVQHGRRGGNSGIASRSGGRVSWQFRGLVRLIRVKHWTEMRAVFVRPLVASVLLVMATVGLSSWAHHLVAAQRNGGDQLYSGAFVVFALLVVVTIGLWLRASITVASKIDFTPRALRWESWLAFGVSLSSIVVIGGTTLWWIQMGLHAPWFLEGAPVGVAASPWSLNLITAVLVMGLATVTALWGASRVAVTYRTTRWNAGR